MKKSSPYVMTSRQINIPYLLKIGEGKIAKIGKYLFDKDMTGIALFWGEGMEKMLGGRLKRGLDEHGIEILSEDTVSSIAVEDITAAAFSLPAGVKAVVGVGGGKVLDFAKYTSYLLRLPYISVPTSMSNDGFCSPTSSLTAGGARKTVKSAIPYGVVIDLDVIAGCPKSFLYSGVGDMIAKVSALWDWKAAFNRGYERFNDFASMMSYNSLDLLFLRHSSDPASPRFQRSLATSLLYSGIAMEIAGTSRPASGSEHLISHALDELAQKPKMHGLQVGTAAYLCAMLQENPETGGVRDILTATGFLILWRQILLTKRNLSRRLSWHRRSRTIIIPFFPSRRVWAGRSVCWKKTKFCGGWSNDDLPGAFRRFEGAGQKRGHVGGDGLVVKFPVKGFVSFAGGFHAGVGIVFVKGQFVVKLLFAAVKGGAVFGNNVGKTGRTVDQRQFAVADDVSETVRTVQVNVVVAAEVEADAGFFESVEIVGAVQRRTSAKAAEQPPDPRYPVFAFA